MKLFLFQMAFMPEGIEMYKVEILISISVFTILHKMKLSYGWKAIFSHCMHFNIAKDFSFCTFKRLKLFKVLCLLPAGC